MFNLNLTVSDADPENIDTMIHNQIRSNHEEMLELMVKGDAWNMREAYERDNEYITELIKKMTNTKVKE